MSAVAPPAVRPLRFSRERYERMVEAGIFGPGDAVELLDGEIVEMAPQKSLHATAVTLLAEALRRSFGDYPQVTVRSQLPLALDTHSQPEPDIAVVRGSARDFRDAHPATALLIVEVSDSSAAYDRGRKLAAYARAGIADYWLLDLAAGVLEVYRDPAGMAYRTNMRYTAPQRVTPLHAGHDVAVADILP